MKDLSCVLLVVFWTLFLSSCEKDLREESTIEMAEMLDRIAREATPESYPYLNSQIAKKLQRQLSAVPYASPSDLRLTYIQNLIYAGDIEQGIEELNKTIDARFPDRQVNFMSKPYLETLAIAYLRLGEQTNCIMNHTASSCLIPIAEEGFHSDPYGSENAIEAFTVLLEADPYDLQARWLLNIAYMTVGGYPQEVPMEYLVPDTVFNSDILVPRFRDRAIELGLDHRELAGGSILEDFNNDGFLDVFATSWGLDDQARIWMSNGDGTFTDRTMEAGIEGIVSGLNTIQADYDNDGLTDILILRGGWLVGAGKQPNSLLKNLGNGKFKDVTRESGLYSLHPTQTAVWFDANVDGNLDLFIGNEWDASELFINQGDGTFRDEAESWMELVKVLCKGVAAGDINNDGLPDLYISNLAGDNLLLLNQGGKFVNIAAEAGVTEPRFSFPAWFWDYNNDGWDDIMTFGFKISSSRGSLVDMFKSVTEDVAADYLGFQTNAEFPRLYLNLHDNTFRDITDSVGLKTVLYTMGSNFGDLDNDGNLDIYAGTGAPDFNSQVPNRMFINRGGLFYDVTQSGGFGQIQKGHGISWGDIDNDGDQDIYTTIGGAVEGDVYSNMLFENPGFGNKWITLRLEGDDANRSAIGAKVRISTTENDMPRLISRTVGTGGSFGASSLQLEIGLGQANRIDSIEVFWPDVERKRQVLYDLDLNTFYSAKQNQKPIKLEPRQVVLSGKGGVHHH